MAKGKSKMASNMAAKMAARRLNNTDNQCRERQIIGISLFCSWNWINKTEDACKHIYEDNDKFIALKVLIYSYSIQNGCQNQK